MKNSLKRIPLDSSESFSDYLVNQGVLSLDQLAIVQEENQRHPVSYYGLEEEKSMYARDSYQSFSVTASFEKTLLALGFFQEDDLIKYLASYSRYDIICLKEYSCDQELLKEDYLTTLQQYSILPLKKYTQFVSKSAPIAVLEIAVVDPYNIKALDQIRLLYHVDRLVIKLCTEQEIVHCFDRLLLQQNNLLKLLKEIPFDISTLKANTKNPIEQLIDFIITQALQQEATDIHFQPHLQWVQLNYRIKGLLQPISAFHKKYWGFLTTRLKIMASLDIANSRLPQSGQFSVFKGYQEIACRLSTHPLTMGIGGQEETIVLRFLNTGKNLFSLKKLGFHENFEKKLQHLMHHPQGLIIIAGPTGSGKTTTAYALLKLLKQHLLKIMTLEEPIEFFFPFLYQTELLQQGDLTFEEALKSILRQDPDLLFIGEIRDRQAAQLAVQTATVGHPVFTTLHASNALSVVSRLINLGIQPQILTGKIHTIIAQRLVQHLCDYCKKPRSGSCGDINKEIAVLLPFLQEAQGCSKCHFTGYQGRLPLIEVIKPNEEFHQLILASDYVNAGKKWAKNQHIIPLAQTAVAYLLEGKISLESVLSEVDIIEWIQNEPECVKKMITQQEQSL